MRSLLSLLLLVALPAAAQARSRAVVLPFSGPKAKQVYRAVVEALERHGRIEVVPPEDLYTAAERAGGSRRSLSDVARLAEAATRARIDAVVRGTTKREGRDSYLHVEVLDGGTGGAVGTHRVRLERGRADKAVARRVVSVAITSILRCRRGTPGGLRRPPPREREQSDEPGLEPLDDLVEPVPLVHESVEPVALVAEPGYVRERHRPSPPGRLFSARAGLVGLRRHYALRGGVIDGQEVPHEYDSGYFPGLSAWAECYPLGLAGLRGAIVDLGVEGFVDVGFVKSDLKIRDAGGKREVHDVETAQRMWGLGLVYRLSPTSLPDGPVAVRLLAGWASAYFALAQRTPLYQSNQYGSLRVGAEAGLPVAEGDGWTYSVLLRAAALYTWAALNSAEAYPDAAGPGWEAAGGLEVDLGAGWVLAFDYRAYGFPASYAAAGEGKPALESDDLYHGFTILAGYGG